MLPLDPEAVPPESIRPLKRSEYDRLVAAGAFEGERVELLYGRLVPMSPQGGAHASAIRRLTRRLFEALGDRAEVQVQCPLAGVGESEPEPDFAVVDGIEHRADHPAAAHLVVEVADSSRIKDLRVKSVQYAEMGIPEYWVLDLTRSELVVHRVPQHGRYQDVAVHAAGAQVALVRFPDVSFAVADLLPAAPPPG